MSRNTREASALRFKPFVVLPGQLARLGACPAAGVFRGPRAEATRQIWWGIMVHRFIEQALLEGRDVALGYISRKYPRALRTCLGIDVERLGALARYEVEVAWARSPVSGQVWRLGPFPDMPTPEEGVYGRADLIFERDGVPHVADFKVGAANIQSPVDHDQLYGLAASLVREAAASEVGVSTVQVEPSGALCWRTITLTRADLAPYEERERTVFLRVLADRVAFAEGGKVPQFVPGTWCAECECAPACPAHGVELQIIRSS